MTEIDINKISIYQPTINIGMLGHVSNGKTSITRSITGISTLKHSSEKKRNITIKLGYANAKIGKCNSCPKPKCYQSYSSNIMSPICKHCKGSVEILRHVSFVDCPGHNALMSVMLNGTCIMDTALLVEACDSIVPKPQTIEHLAAANISGINNMIVCLNKVDLVDKMECIEKYKLLKEFTKGTCAEKSPFIPISANYGYNIDVLCEYICTKIPHVSRSLDTYGKLVVIRSFNINKPGESYKKLIGGVIGGALLQGIIKIGQLITIYPGIVSINKGKLEYKPIRSKILKIMSEKNSLDLAIPGGLIAIELSIDPSIAKNDNLVGNIAIVNNNEIDNKPKVCDEITIKYLQMKNFCGDKTKKIKSIKIDEEIIINVNSANIKCRVINVDKKELTLRTINRPICVFLDDKISIIRKFDNWRLVGMGDLIIDKCNEIIYDMYYE